jgi:hypothetical protein
MIGVSAIGRISRLLDDSNIFLENNPADSRTNSNRGVSAAHLKRRSIAIEKNGA